MHSYWIIHLNHTKDGTHSSYSAGPTQAAAAVTKAFASFGSQSLPFVRGSRARSEVAIMHVSEKTTHQKLQCSNEN